MSETDVEYLRQDLRDLRTAVKETNDCIANVNTSVECLSTELKSHIASNREALIRGDQKFSEMALFVKEATADKQNHSSRLRSLEVEVCCPEHPENGIKSKVERLEKKTLVMQTVGAVKVVGGASGLASLVTILWQKFTGG